MYTNLHQTSVSIPNVMVHPSPSIGLTNLAKPYHVHYHLSQPDMAGPRLGRGATRRAPASVQRFALLADVRGNKACSRCTPTNPLRASLGIGCRLERLCELGQLFGKGKLATCLACLTAWSKLNPCHWEGALLDVYQYLLLNFFDGSDFSTTFI